MTRLRGPYHLSSGMGRGSSVTTIAIGWVEDGCPSLVPLLGATLPVLSVSVGSEAAPMMLALALLLLRPPPLPDWLPGALLDKDVGLVG